MILGELYRQALEAKGYDVVLKPDIGSSEIVHRALRRGALDMYPEYIGVLLSEVAQEHRPPAAATPRPTTPRQAFERRNGFTLLAQTPFADANALAVKPPFARRHRLQHDRRPAQAQGHGEGRRAAGVRHPLRGRSRAARGLRPRNLRPSTPRAASATRCSTAATSTSPRCSRAKASSPATTTSCSPIRAGCSPPATSRPSSTTRCSTRTARAAGGDRCRHPRAHDGRPCATMNGAVDLEKRNAGRGGRGVPARKLWGADHGSRERGVR